jgi:hypothetical protein
VTNSFWRSTTARGVYPVGVKDEGKRQTSSIPSLILNRIRYLGTGSNNNTTHPGKTQGCPARRQSAAGQNKGCPPCTCGRPTGSVLLSAAVGSPSASPEKAPSLHTSVPLEEITPPQPVPWISIPETWPLRCACWRACVAYPSREVAEQTDIV